VVKFVAKAYLVRERVGVARVTVTGGRTVEPERILIGAGVTTAVTMLVEVMVKVAVATVEVLVTVT